MTDRQAVRAEFEEAWKELSQTWNVGEQHKAMCWHMYFWAWRRCENKRSAGEPQIVPAASK